MLVDASLNHAFMHSFIRSFTFLCPRSMLVCILSCLSLSVTHLFHTDLASCLSVLLYQHMSCSVSHPMPCLDSMLLLSPCVVVVRTPLIDYDVLSYVTYECSLSLSLFLLACFLLSILLCPYTIINLLCILTSAFLNAYSLFSYLLFHSILLYLYHCICIDMLEMNILCSFCYILSYIMYYVLYIIRCMLYVSIYHRHILFYDCIPVFSSSMMIESFSFNSLDLCRL